MKKTFRDGLFETNSSSVHTLVYKDQTLSDSRLPIKEGNIIAHFGHFGMNHKMYDSQEDKLSYILTCMAYNCGSAWDDDPSKSIYDDWYFKELEEAVCEHSGAKHIKIMHDISPEIDHQSQPEWSGECKLFNYTKENFLNFIFNDNVALVTDCD